MFIGSFLLLYERMFATLDSIEEAFREHDAHYAALLTQVREYDVSGDWSIDGYQNASAALRGRCRMDSGVAQSHVALARKLTVLPLIAAALGCGDTPARHASTVSHAYNRKRAQEITNIEAELVEAAKLSTPKQFVIIVQRVIEAIDHDRGAADDNDVFDSRRAYLSETLGGTYDLRATLDPFSGLIVETALEAEMRRDLQAGDERTKPQRRADALTAICRLALERGDLGTVGGIRPHLSLIIGPDDLPGVTPDVWDRVRKERHDNG